MTDITVTLDACDPMELMRFPFKQDVYIKLLPENPRTGWMEVEIKGETKEVDKFVELHWG